MTDPDPLSISVVIPAYNASQYLPRTLDSVLAQTLPPREIIVIDDGSTDNPPDLIKPYLDRIRYHRQPNAGVSAARNKGIELADNPWIAFLDADDEWLPDKLQRQTRLLSRHPDLAWTSANFTVCLCRENRRAPKLQPAHIEQLLAGRETFPNYFHAALRQAAGWTGTMLIRKTALLQAGPFLTTQRHGEEDSDMWWRIAYRHPQIGYDPQPLAVYHLDVPTSLTQTRKPCDVYCRRLDRHLELSRQFNRADDFLPLARRLLRLYVRSALFDAAAPDIRSILQRYPHILPPRFRYTIYPLTLCPRLTAAACHTLSRLSRALKLRRQLIRRPSAPAKSETPS